MRSGRTNKNFKKYIKLKGETWNAYVRAAMIMEILGPMATTIEGESQEANANTP